MTKTQGLLTIKQLRKLASTGEIDTVIVAFPDLYGRLMGKRLDTDFFLEGCVDDGVGACNYLLTVDMEMVVVEGYAFANWEKGYGDFKLMADLNTLRVASWQDKTAIVLSDLVSEETHTLIEVAPRSILKRQMNKLAELKLEAVGASELEYYLYQNSYREAAEDGYRALKPVGWYIEDYHILQGSREEGFNGAARRQLKAMGIAVENSKGEWGLGQHELNIRYAPVLTMADHHVLFKHSFKELAEQLGMSVSFMAKPDMAGSGSSCHLHISLWKGKKNAFCGHEQLGRIQCSDLFRWFLGGWIKHVPELMVFYAPTVNAYKRYQAASWAPTGLAWSYDNRTAGFRIVGKDSDALRIECRIPGADCNPYLAYAAVLASGMDGIANQIEPPTECQGDVYHDRSAPAIPGTLQEAKALFRSSEFVKEAFGEAVVEHYYHFFTTEQQAFNQTVTDWELKRYFERI